VNRRKINRRKTRPYCTVNIPYLLDHVSCCYSDIRYNLYVVHVNTDLTVVYKYGISVNLEENRKGDQMTVAVTLLKSKMSQ
jgi:hypothetical protein